METSKIVLNSILYLVLISFFVWLLWKEKEIGEKIKVIRTKFSDFIIFKLKLVIPKEKVWFLFPLHIAVNIALLFVAIRMPEMNKINLIAFLASMSATAFYMMDKKGGKVFASTTSIHFVGMAIAALVANIMIPNGSNITINVIYGINIIFAFVYTFIGEESIRKTVDLTETIVTAVVLVLVIQAYFVGNFLVPTGSMIPKIMPGDRLFGNMAVYKFFKPQRGDILVFKEPLKDQVLYTKRLIGLPGEKVAIGDDNRVYINGKKLEGEKYNLAESDLKSLQRDIANGIIDADKIGSNNDNLERYTAWKGGVFERGYFRGGAISDNEVIIPKKGDTFEYNREQNKYILNGQYETLPIYDFLNNQSTLEKLLRGEKITLTEDYYYVMGDNSGNSLDSRYWGFVAEHRIYGQPFVRFWPLNRAGFIK